MSRNFPNAKTALTEYEKGVDARVRDWDDAWTTFQIRLCQQAQAAAVDKVREAFYQDTKQKECYAMPIAHLREVINADKN